jgi:hypothetical protein
MPRGPRGENRPANMISAAVMVARIATDEIEDTRAEKNPMRRRKSRTASSFSDSVSLISRFPETNVLLPHTDGPARAMRWP